MKLSDIILLQSSIYGQCRGSYFNTQTGEIRVCGLGAISSYLKEPKKEEIIGGLFCVHLAQRTEAIEKAFPMIYEILDRENEKLFIDPDKKSLRFVPMNLGQAIVFMNDDLNYSLAQIAEYVARVEREHPEWYADTENSQNTIETECPSEVLSTA